MVVGLSAGRVCVWLSVCGSCFGRRQPCRSRCTRASPQPSLRRRRYYHRHIAAALEQPGVRRDLLVWTAKYALTNPNVDFTCLVKPVIACAQDKTKVSEVCVSHI